MATPRLISRLIYGPVKSRRLGLSLGINASPLNIKLCSFNCIYCHCGWTQVHTLDTLPQAEHFPRLEDLRKELETALSSHPDTKINYITFSGNGEPTLHPQFDEIVDMVKELRDRYCPQAKVALLSNSSAIFNEKVRQALKKLDQRIMKLDAGLAETFRSINRPCPGVDYRAIVEGLKGLGNITLQTMLVGGRFHNAGDREIEEWIARLAEIRPIRVQLYSLDRPSADDSLQRVPPEKLEEIALQAEQATGVPIEVFYR